MLTHTLITPIAIVGAPVPVFCPFPTAAIGNTRTDLGTSFFYLSGQGQGHNLSALNAFLGFQMPYGSGGSAAMFDLEPGRYEMTWSLEASPAAFKDEIFLWNGRLTALTANGQAEPRHPEVSELTASWQTIEFESFGRVILIALDSGWQADSTSQYEGVQVGSESLAIGFVLAGFRLLRRGHQG